MDGTFDVAPKIARQLFSIHGRIDTVVVPLVFCVMSHKTETAYELMFAELIRIASELNIHLNPLRIISDFEKESVKVAKKFFLSEFKGCLFHFGQIIWRRIQKNRLATRYGRDEKFSLKIRMIKSLAFVPPDEISGYYLALSNNLKKDKDATIILKWFKKNYIGNFSANPLKKNVEPQYHASFWSITGSEEFHFPRTSNNVEAWHRRLQVT